MIDMLKPILVDIAQRLNVVSIQYVSNSYILIKYVICSSSMGFIISLKSLNLLCMYVHVIYVHLYVNTGVATIHLPYYYYIIYQVCLLVRSNHG